MIVMVDHLILRNERILIWQTDEACKVYEHLMSLGKKPNAVTYSLLVDAHLFNRDPKAALSVTDQMVRTRITTLQIDVDCLSKIYIITWFWMLACFSDRGRFYSFKGDAKKGAKTMLTRIRF